MNPYGHSSSRSDASSSHSSPTSSSMYSTASSGIQECFLSQAERLSGSEDDESKSSPTTSSSGHYSDGSWDFKKQMKVNGLPKAAESHRHHKKSKKSKKSKRKRGSPEPEDDDFGKAKRAKAESYDEEFAKASRTKAEQYDEDFAMAMQIRSEQYEGYAPMTMPKVSKKKRHTVEAVAEKGASEHAEISSVMGSNVQKMMAAMGYKQGEGLGKHGQGRVAPVAVSKQKGRRGLGMVIPNIDLSAIQYDPALEVVDLREKVTWLDNRMNYDLTEFDANLCMKIGSKKRTLDDETHFCDPHILKNVLTCKSALDKLQGEEIRRARSKANPFELLKKGPFMNRAALKMANMDCLFEHMFTNPVDEAYRSLVGYSDLLYFADVCAGPGGFSEYVLSKKKWEAKGFGFTLKGDNDFKLADFTAGPCESFEPFYGEHGDGDVYKSRNISSFNTHVMENTDHLGVHFMMADGGFSVDGNENIQEILSKRIYLCQCLVALSIIRLNGHFVCKLFDLFTPFSVGLIYLMYNCFKRISIIKPNTSRPANSERYLVCKWKCDGTESIRDHMVRVNQAFNKYGEACDSEINEIVPLSVLKADVDFYNYICSSNNELGLRQINSLAKTLMYAEDETLFDERQQDLKKACMELWQIPSRTRRGPSVDPDSVCRTFLNNDLSILREQPKNILNYDLNQCLYTIHDFFAVVLGSSSKATFFLGVSHKRCFQYDRSYHRWIATPHDMNLELSPDTLLYGEIVQEVIGESLAQRKINALHIIDGHTLGGKDISQLAYPERIRLCTLYAKALRRPSMNNVMPIRAKKIFELDGLKMAFKRMRDITMKNSRSKLVYCINSHPENNEFFVPLGLMFIKHTKAPFKRFISRTNNIKYFWAPQKESFFDKDRCKESIADFRECYQNSLFWHTNEEENVPFNRQSYVDKLIPFISSNMFTKRDEK